MKGIAVVNGEDSKEFESNSNVDLAEQFKQWCHDRGLNERFKDWTSVGVFGYKNENEKATMRWGKE
jgi:hypothetical protein